VRGRKVGKEKRYGLGGCRCGYTSCSGFVNYDGPATAVVSISKMKRKKLSPSSLRRCVKNYQK